MSGRPVWIVVVVGLLSAGGGAAQESQSSLSLYGYVKFDASWDEALVSAGNFARWVVSPEVFQPHSHFNATARQTRFGLDFSQSRGSAQLSGRVEMDFYGAGAENKNGVQARHAFVRLAWPSGWELLAGQTSDVISPLVPGTLNYTVAWWAGNIGYRRPQFRVTKSTRLGDLDLRVDVAATRTIGDDFVVAEPGDSGSDSGHPTFEGRLGLGVPLGEGRLTLGGHIHRGNETLHTELHSDPAEIATSSWGLDLSAATGRCSVKAEVWDGANLDDQLGGIGQGLQQNDSSVWAISSSGGWAELGCSASGFRVSLGGGVDDPDDEDLLRGFRARNSTQWLTAVRDFGDGLQAGLELSRWETDYIGFATGTSLRVQTSLIYAF